MATETELKFAIVSEEQWARLFDLETIGGMVLAPAVEMAMVDRYLDTDDRAIHRAGFAFRIRASKGKYVACIKGLGSQHDGWHDREEYEQEVDEPYAHLSDWPAGEVTRRLTEMTEGRQTRQLAEIQMTKLKRQLSNEGLLLAEWSLDRMTIEASGVEHHLMELEIELKEGSSASDLEGIATVLREEYGLATMTESKLERALRLKRLSDQGHFPRSG